MRRLLLQARLAPQSTPPRGTTPAFDVESSLGSITVLTNSTPEVDTPSTASPQASRSMKRPAKATTPRSCDSTCPDRTCTAPRGRSTGPLRRTDPIAATRPRRRGEECSMRTARRRTPVLIATMAAVGATPAVGGPSPAAIGAWQYAHSQSFHAGPAAAVGSLRCRGGQRRTSPNRSPAGLRVGWNSASWVTASS